MRVVLNRFVQPLHAAFFISLLAGLMLAGSLPAQVESKSEGKQDPPQEKAEDAESLASLVKKFTGAGNGKAKREIVEKIFAIKGALDKVDAMVAENDKLKSLGDALKMQIVVSAFRALEKKFPDQNLTYAGQFEHLKKYGKRAVDGGLLLMKDYTLHTDNDRAKAWEVLADLGDKSVIPELKKISEDFLFTDQVQLGALYAMAALGDASGVEKKVKEYEDRAKEEPQRGFFYMNQIAFIYSHSRMYKKAIVIHNRLIGHLRMILKQRGEEMPAQEKANLEGTLANMFYNSACSHSLMKDYKWAYVKLQLCLELVHDRYINLIPRDGDFRNLRAHKGFKEWLALAKAKKLPPLKMKKAPAPDGATSEKPEGEKPAKEEKAEPKPPGGEQPAKIAFIPQDRTPAKKKLT